MSEPFKVSPEILTAISLAQTPEEAERTTDQHVIDVFAALNRIPDNQIRVTIEVGEPEEMSLHEASGGKLEELMATLLDGKEIGVTIVHLRGQCHGCGCGIEGHIGIIRVRLGYAHQEINLCIECKDRLAAAVNF